MHRVGERVVVEGTVVNVNVSVRGAVTRYRNAARIVVTDPSQIQLVQ